MIALQPDGKSVNIHCSRDPRKGHINNQVSDWSFKLDGILHNASQEILFSTTAADVVTAALDGYNGTIMCYGQTGAGKTFTMTGSTESYQNRGIIPRAISQLFKDIEDRSDSAINVRISYMEIYNETMFDLLSTLPASMKSTTQACQMQVIEDDQGVYVKGLQSHLAQNEEEALNMLFEGETNRAIAAHTLNKVSSRSHCIFTVYIESHSRVESNAKYTLSKLNFVDLAGSERLSKTQSEGKTKEEAMYINKSLSFLEQVVLALADKRREHVPFRQSKLTHCLKDSIGGICNTRLIANVWAEAAQIEETISTLRFATRMMCIAVEPAVNLHYEPAVMVKSLEKELALLKRELAMHDTLANRSQVNYDPLSEQQRYEIRQQARNFVDGKSTEIDIINVRQLTGVFEAFKEICSQIPKEVEERLRERYTFIDKTDPAAIAAAQQAGFQITDEGELVGEPDPKSGFNVGAVSTTRPGPSSVVNARRRDREREREKERDGKESKDGKEGKEGRKGRAGKGAETLSPPPKSPIQQSKTPAAADAGAAAGGAAAKDEKRDDTSPITASRTKELTPTRPSTPPSRTDAFEDFKRTAGSEIHRILNENKDLLASKKKSYADSARLINCTKEEMDKSLARLDRLREQREREGNSINEDGDIIISEEEYLEIKRVKDLKKVYRENFEELRVIRAEVSHCQKYVDQCRQRLIQEFDTWYEESYLAGDAPADGAMTASGVAVTASAAGTGSTAAANATTSTAGAPLAAVSSVPQTEPTTTKVEVCVENEQERFERLQKALLLAHPESAPFYNAQMRTHRRKVYDAALSQSPLGPHRKPGTPTRNIRNPPPTTLKVQF